MGVELSLDFSEPFLGGGSTGGGGSVPPWAVGIDSRSYVLDTESGEYRREGIEVLQQRNANSNRDVLLLPQDIWRHQDESWHLGAGQRNLDREDSLLYRYSRSFGVDPWTKYQFSLLNETRQLMTLPDDKPSFVQVHNGWLVVIHANTLWWFETPLSTVVQNSITGAGDVISVTYDGDSIITLHDDGKVYSSPDSTTSTERTVTPPSGGNAVTEATFVAYVKDYLVLGVGNELWDITAAAAVLVYTSPVTGFSWYGAAEGLNAIYCGGGSGDKSLVHRVGVKEDGTGLSPAVVAATLPDGENGVAIGSYLGYVFIGTIKGVRMASPASGSGDLVLGALLPTEAPVYGFEGQDRFIWVTGSSINPTPDTGVLPGLPVGRVCGLYRADLSTFTVAANTPAYASDIVAEGQSGKTVRSVATWNDKRVFTVDDGGVYLETENKVDFGWLEPGRISFSVEDLKTGLYCQAKWEPLDGTVAIAMSYDSKPPVSVMNWGVQGSTFSGNIPLNGEQFSRVDVRYVLYRDTIEPTKGPIFTRFEIRARAVKGAASRWYLPILNHESLDINGVIFNRDVTVEFNRLMSFMESGKMFTLQEWGRTYQVVAKDFKWTPQKLDQNGIGWQGIYLLVVEEAK